MGSTVSDVGITETVTEANDVSGEIILRKMREHAANTMTDILFLNIFL